MKTILFSLLLVSANIMAQDNKLTDVPLSTVEVEYWNCDYAASTGLLGFSEAAACSAIFEDIKARKFNGNFQEFMKWWNENKQKEHKKRAK
jgi:hypothetical protein